MVIIMESTTMTFLAIVDPWTILELTVNGVLLAGIYILSALGLSLVFGVMDVVNFGHGAFMMVGGYITFALFRNLGVNPLLSLVVVIPAMFLLGYVIQTSLIENIRSDEEIYSLMLTFGLALVLTGILRELFSTTAQGISYLVQPIQVFSLSLGLNSLIAGVTGLVFTAALFLFLSYTDFGRAIRATAQVPSLAEACGINSPRIRAISMGIGAMLAGVAGVAYLLVYSISPLTGRSVLLLLFVIIVLGGMGSLIGTVISGLLISLFQVFTIYYVGAHQTYFIMYVGIVLLLLVRPHGLLGEPEGSHG
jgi:branched-chain amino acid transport system permease protein